MKSICLRGHSNFGLRRDGTRYCKSCANARTKRWRRKNPERAKLLDKRMDLKRRYGDHMTIEEWNKLTEHGCMICGDMEYLNVDHCHATGKVRGCLCGSCNRGLGQFKDNLDNLTKAVDYLAARQ